MQHLHTKYPRVPVYRKHQKNLSNISDLYSALEYQGNKTVIPVRRKTLQEYA